MPFGPGNYFWGSVTGGEHAFTFKSTSTGDRSNLDIPDTIYRFLRPGVGVHFELPAQFSLALSAGYRYIFNGGGQFKDVFFPNSTVAGIDAQAAVGYRFTPMFEGRLVGDLRRYFSSMNCSATVNGALVNQCDENSPAHPGSNFTAGGAVDQYISVSAVFAVIMGGTEVATAEEAEAPPPPKRKRKLQSEDEQPPLGDEVGGSDD